LARFGSRCRPISIMRADARSAPISALLSTHSLGGSAIGGPSASITTGALGGHKDPAWQGPAYQTCANAAAVCRAFEISRRREVFSFSHHAAVAALAPAEQDGLLDQAEREGWSRQQLREAVHSTRSVIRIAGRSIASTHWSIDHRSDDRGGGSDCRPPD
jgi:hypothetical protein